MEAASEPPRRSTAHSRPRVIYRMVDTIYRPVDSDRSARYHPHMPATRKTAARPRKHPRNAAATRERVLSIAERAFAARGFAGVTLDEIAEAAGVRKATLFYYFESKDVLYAQVAGLVAARFVPLATIFSHRPSLEGLEAAVRELHAVTEAHHDAAALLMREALDDEGDVANSLVGPFVAAAEEWIRAGQSEGQFDSGLPARSIVALVAGAVTLPSLNPR